MKKIVPFRQGETSFDNLPLPEKKLSPSGESNFHRQQSITVADSMRDHAA